MTGEPSPYQCESRYDFKQPPCESWQEAISQIDDIIYTLENCELYDNEIRLLKNKCDGVSKFIGASHSDFQSAEKVLDDALGALKELRAYPLNLHEKECLDKIADALRSRQEKES